MFIELDHPLEGKVKQPGISVKLSETPGRIRRIGPALGEHTREILTEMGYGEEDIGRLQKEGAIPTAMPNHEPGRVEV
jgi:CoA:oxalate CoA-transferase